MVCERFIGSGRLQEGGYLGTHKQDFEAHRKGCDWRHDATHIDMNPIIPSFPGLNVQETLELLSASITEALGLPEVLTINNHAGSNPIIMDMNYIHELQNPVLPQDAATKWYVDQQLIFVDNWYSTLIKGNFSGGVDVDINGDSRIINSDEGGGFTISLTDNLDGYCSPFYFSGGDGYSGSGFNISCGSGTTSDGGSVNITAGNSSNATGGSVIITSGAGVVNGTITLNAGTPLYWPTSDGTSGQSIITDGNGNLSFGTTGYTDHGLLTGLSDDDHLQYLLINGTRAMTGDLNMGSNDIGYCLSCRAPANTDIVIGADTMYQTYHQGSSGVQNYLQTVINSTTIFQDSYYDTREYSRNTNASTPSDIPSSGIITFTNNGKQFTLARHWGSYTTIIVETQLNYI